MPFSKAQPEIFKVDQLKPVKDLKLLIRDYLVSWPIANNVNVYETQTACGFDEQL